MDEKNRSPAQPSTEEKPGWNELVSAASDHARERREALAVPESPKNPRLRKRFTLTALLLVLLGVAGWNYHYFFVSGEPSEEFEEVALKASLFMAQQAIEERWEETGAFPTSLEEANADEEGLSYSVSEAGYVLSASGIHHQFIFRRGDDLEPYRSAFQSLLSREVRR